MIITYSDSIDLGKTPARVNRLTGEIFLNMDIWETLPEAYQNFILAHEEGHYYAQTTNELLADHYAFMKMAGKESESLKNSVNTILDILPGTSDNQKTRILNIYRLALTWDLRNDEQAATKQQLEKVERDLNSFKDTLQLKDYEAMLSTLRNKKPVNYTFPGYDPGYFQPAVGRWFHDEPILNSEPITTTFQKRFTNANDSAGTTSVPANETTSKVYTLDDLAEMFPPMNTRVQIDLQTLLLAGFGVAILILLNKYLSR